MLNLRSKSPQIPPKMILHMAFGNSPCKVFPKGNFGSAFLNRFPPWQCAMARQLPWHFDTTRRGEAGTQTPFPLRRWLRKTGKPKKQLIQQEPMHIRNRRNTFDCIDLSRGFPNWEPTKPIHFTLRPAEVTRYSLQNLEISFHPTKKGSKVFPKVIVFDGNLPNGFGWIDYLYSDETIPKYHPATYQA